MIKPIRSGLSNILNNAILKISVTSLRPCVIDSKQYEGIFATFDREIGMANNLLFANKKMVGNNVLVEINNRHKTELKRKETLLQKSLASFISIFGNSLRVHQYKTAVRKLVMPWKNICSGNID